VYRDFVKDFVSAPFLDDKSTGSMAGGIIFDALRGDGGGSGSREEASVSREEEEDATPEHEPGADIESSLQALRGSEGEEGMDLFGDKARAVHQPGGLFADDADGEVPSVPKTDDLADMFGEQPPAGSVTVAQDDVFGELPPAESSKEEDALGFSQGSVPASVSADEDTFWGSSLSPTVSGTSDKGSSVVVSDPLLKPPPPEAKEEVPPPVSTRRRKHKSDQPTDTLRDDVRKDVVRTHSTLAFFQKRSSLEGMCRVLYVYGRLNPGLKYVQGMNELLAPLFYVCFNTPNPINVVAAARGEGTDPGLNASVLEGLDPVESGQATEVTLPEALSFFVFTALMSETRDLFLKPMDNSSSESLQCAARSQRRHAPFAGGINALIERFSATLKRVDPEIHGFLERLGVDPCFFGYRWCVSSQSSWAWSGHD
jgi:hypothetical protein